MANPEIDDVFGTVPASTVERLITNLQGQATAQGLVDVGYVVHDSPVGRLLLAATPAGVVRVAFEAGNQGQVLQELATKISPRVLESPGMFDSVRTQLDEYFAGTRTRFDLDVDRQLSHGFRRQVVTHLSEIPYGSTESYAQVAAALENPKAVRAVGSACATNPIPIIVPCHRVLRSDGSLGGYLGGLHAKTLLLDLERGSHEYLY